MESGPENAAGGARKPILIPLGAGEDYSTPAGSAGPPVAPPSIPDHELIKRIGHGSYGEVWLARNIMGAYRAIKIVFRSTFESERPYEREFEGLKKFEPVSRTHESQVDVLHVGQGEGYFYYVMELADAKPGREKGEGRGAEERGAAYDGIDPGTYVPRTLKSDLLDRGRLGFEECVQIGLALTTAIEHLHENGLIHRDIKPANIIFVNGLPKLADIGLVANVDATCSFVGTEGYLPPEGPGTPQADLYSLGRVLYEISTGKDRHEFPELPANLGSAEETRGMMELNAVVLRACKSSLKERYQSAGEMRQDLLILLAGRSVRQTHDLERRLTQAKRIAVAMAALIVFGVVPYYLAIKEARSARLAEADAKEKLLGSYLPQAQALRWSHRAGRRFEGLELIRKAADIRPSLELRNEAIALMALPDIRLSREVGSLPEPVGLVRVDFDMTNERYATRDGRGDILVRKLSDNREIRRLPGHGARPDTELNFSADGRLLAAYGEENVGLVVWDVDQSRDVLILTNNFARTPEFSADDRRIVLCEEGSRPQRDPGSIVCYGLGTGQKTATLPVSGLPVNFKLDPFGHLLAVSFDGGQLRIYDLESGQITRVLTNMAGVGDVRWHPNGKWLAAGSPDGTINLWDLVTGQLKTTFRAHQSAATGIAFGADGDLMATRGWDGRLRLWDVPAGNELCNITAGRNTCFFSPDGRSLGCFLRLDTLGICEVSAARECRLLKVLQETSGETRSCAFSPNGRMFASAHKDGFRLWDTADWKQIAYQKQGDTFTVAFHPRRRSLLTSGQNGLMEWPLDLPSGGALPTVDMGVPVGIATEAPFEHIGLAHQGNKIASVVNGEVHLLDADTGQLLRRIQADYQIMRANLSPDGRWCAAGTWLTNSFRVYETENEGGATILPACTSTTFLLFSHDGRWLVDCGINEYRFFQSGPWRQVSSVRRGSGETHGFAAFSPDGQMAAVADSQSIRLVDPATGGEFAAFEGRDPRTISWLEFSPDGTSLVVGALSDVIQVWDLRLIRSELAAMNLDWDLPPIPEPAKEQRSTRMDSAPTSAHN